MWEWIKEKKINFVDSYFTIYIIVFIKDSIGCGFEE